MRDGVVRRGERAGAQLLTARKVSPGGPDSNRQRPPPSAGARKRLCPPGRHASRVGEGGRERGAPGLAGAVSRHPREERRAGPGASCVGRARAGSSRGGRGWGRARGTGSRRPARLAPQLLRWHLQDCGGLGGPRRCGDGRGRGGPAAFPHPPPHPARSAACSTPSGAVFQHQTMF